VRLFNLLTLIYVLSAIPVWAADETDLENLEAIPGHPKYSLIKPGYALSLGGSMFQTPSASLGTPLMLSLEFQPRFLQGFGIIGFGPMLGSMLDSNIYAGGLIRYQLVVLHEQLIVPTVSYEYLNPFSTSGSTSAQAVMGPAFGAWLFLNVLDSPDAGSHFFTNVGIVRSYLVAEYHTWSSLPLSFFYFGLRLEW